VCGYAAFRYSGTRLRLSFDLVRESALRGDLDVHVIALLYLFFPDASLIFRA
jgi:hypothetical protein